MSAGISGSGHTGSNLLVLVGEGHDFSSGKLDLVPGQNHHHATLILRPGLPPRGQDRQEWLYCSAKACPSVHLQSTMSDLFLSLHQQSVNIFLIKVTVK